MLWGCAFSSGKSGFPIMWRNSSLTKQIFTLGEVMTVSVRRNQWQYVIAEIFKWIRFLQGDCAPKSDCACIQRLGPWFDWKSTLMAQTPNNMKQATIGAIGTIRWRDSGEWFQFGVVCLIRFVKVNGLKICKNYTQEIAVIPGLVGDVASGGMRKDMKRP